MGGMAATVGGAMQHVKGVTGTYRGSIQDIFWHRFWILSGGKRSGLHWSLHHAALCGCVVQRSLLYRRLALR